jgi:hypothetical protein
LASRRSTAQQILPGLSYLGTGRQEDLLQKAAKEGIQLLAVFESEVKIVPRTGVVNNETELFIFDVAKKAQLFPVKDESGNLRLRFLNTKVQGDRMQNKDDGLNAAFTKLFQFVDKNLTMGDVPEAIQPEHVQGRVSALASEKHADVLPVLCEITFWQRRNLLGEAEMLQAFKTLLGDENGEKLATGDEETKKKAIEKSVPKF